MSHAIHTMSEFEKLQERTWKQGGQRRKELITKTNSAYSCLLDRCRTLENAERVFVQTKRLLQEEVAAHKKTNLMIMKNLKKLERWGRKVTLEYGIEEPMPTDC